MVVYGVNFGCVQLGQDKQDCNGIEYGQDIVKFGVDWIDVDGDGMQDCVEWQEILFWYDVCWC